MPSQKRIGTPSAANDKLGGIPRVHYLDSFSRGRGQVVRLMLIDAGAAFDDIRYPKDEFYRDHQANWMAKGGLNPTGKLPAIELNGQVLTQTYSILRHWSRLLGNAYDGDTEGERYKVDRLADIGVDYRTIFVNASKYSSPDEHAKYKTEVRPSILAALERHMEESRYSANGPFVIGPKFTYADMIIFQVLHDEGIGKGDQADLADFPRLKALYDAVTKRPNIEAFFASSDYRG